MMIRVTVWNENVHERELPEIAKVYPEGMRGRRRSRRRMCGWSAGRCMPEWG